jgi:hypothetical protein
MIISRNGDNRWDTALEYKRGGASLILSTSISGEDECKTGRNLPVIGYWQLGTIPLQPARLRGTRHQVSSDAPFRGVLKGVTRERCGSQGTPFRRVLSTTISGGDMTAKLGTHQSFVAGGHPSRTEIFLTGCIEGRHARTVRLPRNTIP